MFLGEYRRKIDAKNRLALPATLRPDLREGAVLTLGADASLHLYPASKWRSLAQALDDVTPVSRNNERLRRSFFAGSTPCRLDGQGRLVIPEPLRSTFAATTEVVVLGVFSHVEIWPSHEWSAEQERYDIAQVDVERLPVVAQA